MEEDQKNLNVDDKKLDLKNLLISKPDEEVNDGASSSNEDKKRNEEDSKESASSPKKEEIIKTPTPPRTPSPPPRNSPEPSCAICLEQLTNKSFTNSCFHMFCFTCLVEWSKVKPECPLCKQSFTSIVHNVRSFEEYDQYHINKSKTTESWLYDRRFRYATTMTSERIYNRNRADYSNIIENEITSHRMRYAPHSVRIRTYSPHTARRISTPCAYRRRIYDENLWVRPASSDRIRYAAPAFFQRNIACTHRLLPWLNRELLAVMPNNESQVSFVIELIMALIVKYHITSQEFFTHIEPYTGPHTSHFIHEFYNFAVSPFDMENYDFNAHSQYSSLPFEVHVASSPDSDVIPLPMSDSSRKSSTSESKRKKKHHSRKKHSLDSYNRHLAKIVLKRNSENNCWETVDNSAPLLNYSEVSSTNPYEVPGPSTSRDTGFPGSPEISSQDLEKSNEVECIQDDECQIVEILKPKHERTPEIIDLSSDDEATKAVTASSSVENECVPSTSVIEVSSDSPVSSGDEDDIVFLSETRLSQEDLSNGTSDKPIDYSLKTTDKKTEDKSCYEEIEPVSSNSTDNAESESSHAKKTLQSALQSAVRVLSHDDACSSSWSPLAKPKKRKASILDDSSTESCSESAQVSELESRIKKLKLRSVVAHFSFDPCDEHNDLTHHSSSHKKHKERKKKKKKHKHRHRVYSSDTA